MSEAIATELGKLENDGVEAFDAHKGICHSCIATTADNPRASDILDHLGGSARRYCRMCMVSRTVQCTCICILYNLNITCAYYMYHVHVHV